MRKVTPGEPITSQHLSARWYNHTITPINFPPEKKGRHSVHNENELLAFCLDPPVARFDPVGLDSKFDSYSNRASKVHSVSKAALNEYNWIIPQAAMTTAIKSQPCVYFGVTYANVTISSEHHHQVTLDPTTNKLVSSFYGRGQILVGAAVSPDSQIVLISIGNHSATNRLVRFVLTGSFTDFSAPAIFKEIDGTEIGSGTLFDPEGISVGELTTGWTGYAMYQDNMYIFVNAECDQEPD